MGQVIPDKLLQKVHGKRVLVIGDLMLDEYVWGAAERISPEAPVPIVRAEKRTYAPGGAANVAANIQSLGGQSLTFGVIGDDAAGHQLVHELRSLGAEVNGVVVEPKRWTTLKTRIMAQRQQIARVDHEQNSPVADATIKELGKTIDAALPRADVVVLSDYSKGLLRRSLVAHAIDAARKKGKPVIAGPKPESLVRYAGATLVSFNRHEAAAALHARSLDDPAIEDAGKELLASLNVNALAITLGSRGVALFEQKAKRGGIAFKHIAARSVEVFDVAGAGDTFLAATSLAIAARVSMSDAVAFGNLAAAAAVRKVGVVAVTPRDLETL